MSNWDVAADEYKHLWRYEMEARDASEHFGRRRVTAAMELRSQLPRDEGGARASRGTGGLKIEGCAREKSLTNPERAVKLEILVLEAQWAAGPSSLQRIFKLSRNFPNGPYVSNSEAPRGRF